MNAFNCDCVVGSNKFNSRMQRLQELKQHNAFVTSSIKSDVQLLEVQNYILALCSYAWNINSLSTNLPYALLSETYN